MNRDSWQQVKKLFAEALERPREQRNSFLEEACKGDDDLRREVETLIQSHEQALRLRLFESPISEDVLPRDMPENRRVGAYRLIRLIGHGGMGDVYAAERADEQFRKQVAVKLIRPGTDSNDVVRRFRYERQILAGLDHPHIARLLDGGATEDGRPYIVMEYVEGIPLDRYCDEHALGIDERLRLFRTVCDAVAYAHRSLVVHRDLKPGNMLVDGQGNVKLVDFGIAKLLDPTLIERQGFTTPLTRRGMHLMTPDYASPEQVRGQLITTASDIYSLGVILYELLTGLRPYRLEGLTPGEIEHVVTETVPVRPSTAVTDSERASGPAHSLRSRLRGDLDTIVMKALRKEPQRRYSSVEQLSDDVRRHLAGLPVTARDDTLRYRANKFVRRHRVSVAAAVLVILSLLGGLASTAWQAGIARQQRDVARLEAEKTQRINAFLQSILASADPFNEGRDVRVTELLAGASARIATELGDQPEIAAALHHTLGVTYTNLGRLDSADLHLGRALALRGGPGDEADLASTLHAMGNLHAARGAYERSEESLLRAIDAYSALPRTDSLLLAGALNDLGVLLRNTGRDEEAERVYRWVLGIYRRSPEAGDQLLAEVLNNLAVLIGTRGELAEARVLHEEALEIIRARFPGDHPAKAYTLFNLAGVLDAQTLYDQAEPLYREALAMRERLFGANHGQTISAMTTLANMLWLRGDYAKGEPLAREARRRAHTALPDGHPLTAYAEIVLGQVLMDSERPREAEPHLRVALALRRRSYADDHWLVANTKSALGACLTAEGHYDEAEALLVAAYETLRADRGPDHETTRLARRRLAELYRATGRPHLAEQVEQAE